MKTLGIILAGGTSSRLYPSTLAITKQLLPIYDKPLIYYPLSTLMLAGIRDFVIIVVPNELQNFQKLFANCEQELGISIRFATQESPRGIADAFNIVKHLLGETIHAYDSHALILGDNIFYGAGFTGMLQEISVNHATVFASHVTRPEQYGVVEFNGNTIKCIHEKPQEFKGNYAVTGLYFYPRNVYIYVDELSPSARHELEITDLNNVYLNRNELNVVKLPRGMMWFDTGNADAMLEASNVVSTLQTHQNVLIGSPHEIAIKNGWVTTDALRPFINKCAKTQYGIYLRGLL